MKETEEQVSVANGWMTKLARLGAGELDGATRAIGEVLTHAQEQVCQARAWNCLFRFAGRMNRRKLKVGRYRLVAVPTDAAGNRGQAIRRGFRIIR